MDTISPSKSMTALAPSDNQTAAIQSVYQLGQTCTQGVDSETSRRIRVIRERLSLIHI